MQIITIQNKIFEVRGKKVMLDFDIAEMYDIETKRLKAAVRRNLDRFPPDFMFQLTRQEWEFQRTQFVSFETGKGRYPKYLPFAFTEHGVTMLASILNSSKAIQVNIAIVRAFITLREFSMNFKELSAKLTEMEKKYNMQFKDVYEAINYLMEEKKVEEKQKKRVRIGFKK